MLVPIGREGGTGVEYVGVLPILISSSKVKSEKCDDLYAEKVWTDCGMEVPKAST